MNSDPWLDPWLPLVAERVGSGLVLELGCGGGADTAVLARAGHRVVALDLSRLWLTIAKMRAPSCEFHRQDIRAAFPVPANKVNVIVASLSLHYFSWEETERLVERIQDVLGPAGLLLCRLNSTKDENFGAKGHPAIEENYYLVDGAPKRFFDRAAVDRLFARGWRVRHLEEKVVHRYVRPKSLWEAVLEKARGPQ
jgi:SAM-dependent methyltransferase